MRNPIKKPCSYLLIILIAATVITLAGSLLTYLNAKNAAEDSLRFQALGIAASLEVALRKSTTGREAMLQEIITEGVWEGIAFISLYGREGQILLHSNKSLIGRKAPDSLLERAVRTQTPASAFTTLGTGERVFVMDIPLTHSESVLRLALHPYPVEIIVRQARSQVISTAFLVLILWTIGFFSMRVLRRSEEMKREMAEREQLAVLGEMASVLAHEIRNPLGSIKGFAQYILEQGAKALSIEDQREYLQIMVKESKRLEALTEDLLIYARPVARKTERFALAELVRETLNSFSQLQGPSSPEVRISVPESLQVKSDRDKLKQVLTNIIQNSLEVFSEGGVIRIHAEAFGVSVRITIEDNGPGMDDATQQNIFKPFFTTKTRGTGLGLAIVATLINALGGTIKVESIQGKGTSVVLEIPGEVQDGT